MVQDSARHCKTLQDIFVNSQVIKVHTSSPGSNKQTGDSLKAESFKTRANEAFKAGDFDGAIAGYSGAVQADPKNPVYFSNRAMAYLKVSSLCLICCSSL